MQGASPSLLHAATLVLGAFSVLAVVDGIYIHLVQLRLHERPGSYREHLWHTAGALLAVPGLYAMFAIVSGGPLLWFGITVTVLGQIVEWLDMVSEKESRAPLGGLSSAEYVLHVVLSTTRNVAVALSLAARPSSAFSLSGPSVIAVIDEPYRSFVWLMLPGAAGIALVHLWLALRARSARVIAGWNQAPGR